MIKTISWTVQSFLTAPKNSVPQDPRSLLQGSGGEFCLTFTRSLVLILTFTTLVGSFSGRLSVGWVKVAIVNLISGSVPNPTLISHHPSQEGRPPSRRSRGSSRRSSLRGSSLACLFFLEQFHCTIVAHNFPGFYRCCIRINQSCHQYIVLCLNIGNLRTKKRWQEDAGEQEIAATRCMWLVSTVWLARQKIYASLLLSPSLFSDCFVKKILQETV